MTGRYQQRFGHETNPGISLENSPAFGLPTTELTMGDRFRALGYATGWVGKSHLGRRPPYHPNVRGFDYFFGFLESHHDYFDANAVPDWSHDLIQENGAELETNPPGPALPYLTTLFGAKALAFIEAHATEPFFLYLPFNAVHFHLQATQDLLDRTAAPFPQNRIGSPRHLLAATLLGVDDAIAAILAKLRQPIPNNSLNIESDTLIFFTSDNGADTYFGGSNGASEGKENGVV